MLRIPALLHARPGEGYTYIYKYVLGYILIDRSIDLPKSTKAVDAGSPTNGPIIVSGDTSSSAIGIYDDCVVALSQLTILAN